MKKSISIFCLFCLFLFSSNLSAQTSNEAWTKFNAEKKSELAAGVLEWLIPIVGHAYAGDAQRGLLPAGVSLGGFVLIIASGGDTGLVTAGLLGYLVGRIWGIVSAVETASDFNNNLKMKLNLSFKQMKFPNNSSGYSVTLSLSLN